VLVGEWVQKLALSWAVVMGHVLVEELVER